MSEKDDRCEVCKMPRSDHKVFSHHCPKGHWDFAETTFVEPVTSPQATRAEGRMKRITTTEENMKRANQPAARTTPCKHECGFDGVHQICQCVECGHEWPNKESEGTTPQAERPKGCGCKVSTGICGCLTFGTGRLDHNGFWQLPCPHGSENHTCMVRAVAPVETPNTKSESNSVTFDGERATNFPSSPLKGEELQRLSKPYPRDSSPALFEETRLTAEQFWREWIRQDLEIRPAMELASTRAIRFAEAFRDKSEAGLLERIEQLMGAVSELNSFDVPKALVDERMTNAGLREEIERLKRERGPQTVEDGFGSVWPPCEKHNCEMQVMRPGDARCPHCETEDYIDRLNRELTELRAKLAVAETYGKVCDKQIVDLGAELAALREREQNEKR
jgi:hypothetical protein